MKSTAGRRRTAYAALAWIALVVQTPAQQGDWVSAQKKISDTRGKFDGVLGDEDVFGISVAPLGDFDGDGIVDVAIGAQFDDDGGTDRGAVWLLYLNQNGAVRTEKKISQIQGAFGGTLADGDAFGHAITSLGDLDGDGVTDLAVSSLFDDDGGVDRGAVWIVFLEANGTVKTQQKISSTSGGFGGALDDGDLFGISLANPGDLDGDGIVDLVAGAHTDDDGGIDRGAVWIILLNSDGTVKLEKKISQTSGGFPGMLADGDQFGDGVTPLGDLDGDGTVDLAVGAHASDDTGELSGAIWIVFLNPDQTVKAAQRISGTSGGFVGELDAFDLFGLVMGPVGDLDGDGLSELGVGAVLDDDGGVNRGAFWILFLNTDGTVRDQEKISSTAGGFGGNLRDEDHFGRPHCLGDVNSDGVDDLVVGATGTDDGGSNRGAAWILLMNECSPASLAVRNGTGTNPVILSGATAPELGSLWTATLDASGHEPGMAVLVARARSASGLFIGGGEVLVDLGSTRYLQATDLHTGVPVTFPVSIPFDAALCGLQAYFQGILIHASGITLSNALDAVLGN